MAAGDDLQAYNALKVAASLYKDANLDFLYISILIKMKKYDDAVTYIKYSSDIWGDDPILKLLRINLFLRLKKYSDATEEAIKLTEIAPELSGVLYYCGVVGIKDYNLPVVEKCAKRLVELSGEEIDNIVLALHLYLANEMMPQAREIIGKFLSNSDFLSIKNYDTICKIAEMASACGMWNEAIMAGNELIKINKNNAKGYIFVGGACEQLNKMNEASRYYNKAEKLGTDEYENVKLLNYYAKSGSFDDTIRIYKSKNGKNINEDYFVILGDYKLGNGDKKGAEKCWRDAVEKYPGYMSIRAKLRLYNLCLNETKINIELVEKNKVELKQCYTEWEAKQTQIYIIALKSNNIPYNQEELKKILNLQVITQEYSAILK
jgi:tetratricopeptide (TPR) repeat protein